jgi:hypothetical protein
MTGFGEQVDEAVLEEASLAWCTYRVKTDQVTDVDRNDIDYMVV